MLLCYTIAISEILRYGFVEIRVLKYFLAVVREENLSKAAESLYMTQPTLSRQIAALEEELGTTLFVRGKKLALTEDGIIFRRRAEEIVQMVEKTEREFSESAANIGGTISIGTGGLYSFGALTEIMSEFKEEYPNVQFEMYTNSADHVKERLDKGLLDFGLLLEPIDIEKYDFIRMKDKERWGLLVNADSDLAKKDYITKDDLHGIPIITTNRMVLQKEFSNWLGTDFGELNIFGTYNLLINAAKLVRAGHANALTIEGAADLYNPSEMVFKPLKPELSMTSVLAWKKFQPTGRAAGKLMEKIKSAFEA